MEKIIYPDEMKIKDALQIYFTAHNFEDGGYNDKYYKIKLGLFNIPVPNTESRLKAVKFHDIHHMLTEYTADWRGEVEIAGWELASGCGNILVAWVLNFGSFGVGLILFPKRLFNAFMRGRKAKTNLYYNYVYDETLLNRSIGEMRQELDVYALKHNSVSDYLYFSFFVLLFVTVISMIVCFLRLLFIDT